MLFTYLHLAAGRECTDALLEQQVTGIAYETVQVGNTLPLLAPMSEVAGRLAPQVGAYNLMRFNGGRGVLPGGVPGVAPAKVVVIGAGVSGLNAAQIAVGMGADVTVLDLNVDRLRFIDAIYQGRLKTLVSTSYAIEQEVLEADLVIGAVLIPGAKAPTLVSNELVSRMKPGSVLVDIAIDQGGCFEDSRPTTHAEPTYQVHNSIFYCVANMPGSVANTSTYALTNATLPYAVKLADLGWKAALQQDAALALGLNTHAGRLTNDQVALALDLPPCTPGSPPIRVARRLSRRTTGRRLSRLHGRGRCAQDRAATVAGRACDARPGLARGAARTQQRGPDQGQMLDRARRAARSARSARPRRRCGRAAAG